MNQDIYENTIEKLKILTPSEQLYKEQYFQKSIPSFNDQHIVFEQDAFDASYAHTVKISKQERYLPSHESHSETFQIFYVLSGSCEYSIFQKTQLLSEGDLCMISPSTIHTISVNDDTSIIMKIQISTSTISDLFSLMLRSENPISSFFFHSLHSVSHQDYLLFHTYGDTNIRNRILEMYLDSQIEDQYTKHLLNNLLNVFFIKLVREFSPVDFPASPKTEDRFKIVYYLINHFTDVTLEDVAREFNFSVAYCSRYIKSVTGYTFSQLKTKLKFEYIAKRLITTNDSITSLSDALGYENPENFIRAFKKYYHMTPSEYRKTHS